MQPSQHDRPAGSVGQLGDGVQDASPMLETGRVAMACEEMRWVPRPKSATNLVTYLTDWLHEADPARPRKIDSLISELATFVSVVKDAIASGAVAAESRRPPDMDHWRTRSRWLWRSARDRRHVIAGKRFAPLYAHASLTGGPRPRHDRCRYRSMSGAVYCASAVTWIATAPPRRGWRRWSCWPKSCSSGSVGHARLLGLT